MTQEKLAEETEASVNTISSIERGIRSPSFELLEKISNALGVEMRELFDFFPNSEVIDNPSRKEIYVLTKILRNESPQKVKSITEIIQFIFPKLK